MDHNVSGLFYFFFFFIAMILIKKTTNNMEIFSLSLSFLVTIEFISFCCFRFQQYILMRIIVPIGKNNKNSSCLFGPFQTYFALKCNLHATHSKQQLLAYTTNHKRVKKNIHKSNIPHIPHANSSDFRWSNAHKCNSFRFYKYCVFSPFFDGVFFSSENVFILFCLRWIGHDQRGWQFFITFVDKSQIFAHEYKIH